MKQLKVWARSENFHLRRLASEGTQPKLLWTAKLDIRIDNPKPVFDILEQLKNEQVTFVKKSVARMHRMQHPDRKTVHHSSET